MEVKNLPDISAIQPDRLVKYRVSEDKFSAEVLLPGLSYTDFDQKIGGKISLWSLGKMFEALRTQGKMSTLGFVPGPQHEKSMFVASQSMHFSKEIHNMRYAKLFGKKRPLKTHLYLSNVGGASFTIVTELFDSKTGQKLGRNVWVAVCIDMKSRKPITVPEHMSSTSAKNHLMSIENVTIRRPVLPVIPDNAFQYEVRGRHSDCDMNQHITQATYLRWCSDAGSMGALKGCFSQFKRHIELYPIKCAEYHFIGEARVNETVNVNVWEDGTRRKRTLFFAIQNKGRIIFIMNMEFYDGNPAKVSPNLESKL